MYAFKEGLKELLRTALLAAIPIAIASLANSGQVDINAVAIAGLLAGLKAADTWIDEWGKKNDSRMATGGLTRF